MSMDTRIGTELGGYRIDSVLGRGGMSVVYLATDTRLKRKAALKILAPELAEDERFRDRFGRESEIAASLDHPNIVPIYAAGEADGQLYIAMKHVEGTDLAALIRAEGPLDPERTVALLDQGASALDAAHARGLVHRDVKPGNMLLAFENGGREHLYLTDFGLTKRTASVSGLTQTGQFMGTVDYVAPEQIQGQALDGRADQYSLACVAHECLTGSPPFRRETDVATLWAHVNETPPAVAAERTPLPASANRALAKGMAKSPADRYTSCSEFVADLDRSLQPGAGLDAAGQPAISRRRPSRRWLGIAAAVLVVVGAVAWFLASKGGSKEPTDGGPSTPALAVLPRGVNRIDLATNRSVANVPVENTFGEVAIGGGFVWALNHAGIAKIDPDTNRQIAQIEGVFLHLTGGPTGVWAFDSEQTSPGVFNSAIVAIDSATNRARTLYEVPTGVADMVFADGFVWYSDARGAGNGPDPVVVRLDPSNGRDKVFHPESVPGGCSFEGCQRNILAIGGGAAWYINEDGTLSRLDLATQEDQKIALGKVKAVTFWDDYVWVLLLNEDKVVQLDPDRLEPIKEIPVGPDTLSITVAKGSIWAVSRGEGSIWRIDAATAKVKKIGIGPGPGEVAVDDTGAWVTR